MRTHRIRPVFALLWFAVLAFPAIAIASQENGLLWRIQAEGATADYVFGTIHIEDPRVLDLPNPVTEALAGADTFVMELEPNLEFLRELASAMTYADDRNLEQLLGPELYKRAVTALASRGVPESVARQMKPWAVLVTLNVPPPKTGMVLDLVLYSKAVQQGKTIHGLESSAEQLSVFADLPMSVQIGLIRETLDNEPLIDEIYQSLVEAYLARDLRAMQKLSDQAIGATDAPTQRLLETRLVTDRNHLMVERMLPYLHQGSAFVAVGALHLPGPEGILNLLRKQGYEVTRVY